MPSRTRVRPALQEIGLRFGANVKVVEVPPGPPVLSPLVAEIYGPEAEGRRAGGQGRARACSRRPPGVVDVDDSSIADAPRTLLLVDRRKAALLGVPQQAIVTTLRAGLAGEATAYLHDQSKYPAAATLQLPAERHGDLDALLQLAVRSADGKLVPIRELVTRERHAARAAGLPQGPAAGELRRRPTWPARVDSPLYGMFEMRGDIGQIATPGRRHAGRVLHPPARATPTAATRSSGTASGRSPTRPSATWARPMRVGPGADLPAGGGAVRLAT